MKPPRSNNSDKNQILKKHVATIHIGAKLSLLQRKLVNALLYNAYDTLLTEQNHQISASILCEMIGFDSKNISHLKAALKGLMETVVEFDILEEDGKRSWEAMVLLPYAKIKDGVCTYRYDRALAEKMYRPDVYAKINLSVLRELNSTHALVLYENCYRYVDIGHTGWWDVDMVRKLMAVDMMPSYKPFKALNRNVLQPAMKEVNRLSNIQVEMETRNKGRTVTGLRFLVRPNPQLSMISMEGEDNITNNKAYQALRNEGISKTLARSWVLDYGEEYIFEKLELAQDQEASGKIRSSKAGFLKSAITDDYSNENSLKKKRLAEAEKSKLDMRRREDQIDALRKELRAAENSYRKYCGEIINKAFSALEDEGKDEVKDDFRRSLSSRLFVEAFDNGGWSDLRIFTDAKAFWHARGLSLPSHSEWAQKSGSKEPQAIKAEIDSLDAMM